MYWLKQRDVETNDLDQVGLTLRSDHGAFFVAAVATKNGKPTVDGIMPGDRLVRVAGLETATATWGALFAALHGQPGAQRTLTIDRNGQMLVLRAPVTAF
jgi:C-terminal processing protease CtpA/Prc